LVVGFFHVEQHGQHYMTTLNIPKIFIRGSERGQVTCRRPVPGRACVEPRVCPIKSPYKAILPDAGATDEREGKRDRLSHITSSPYCSSRIH